jgi:DNA invertase Pin-like site-specific DNA recombinase
MTRSGAQLAKDMRASGVGLFLLKQGLDSETPIGRAMLGMCCVFAELEREIIRERVHAGLARARSKGKRLSRKPVGAQTEERIRALRAKGHGILRRSTSSQYPAPGAGRCRAEEPRRPSIHPSTQRSGSAVARCNRGWS